MKTMMLRVNKELLWRVEFDILYVVDLKGTIFKFTDEKKSIFEACTRENNLEPEKFFQYTFPSDYELSHLNTLLKLGVLESQN